MIYIKRFLWALGYVLVFIVISVLGVISLFLSPVIIFFYYIKNGDIETTPDIFLPFRCCEKLDTMYKKLEPKLREEE